MNIRIFEVPDIRLPFSFSDSKQIYHRLREYAKADREMFILLFLDAKNQVIDVEFHSIGDVNTNHIYMRQVFRSALLNNALSMICVHNHPGGSPSPSPNDKALTRRLVRCGELLDIDVMDHIIISKDGYYSFEDKGLIMQYKLENRTNFFDK